jgi:hypothetical protein
MVPGCQAQSASSAALHPAEGSLLTARDSPGITRTASNWRRSMPIVGGRLPPSDASWRVHRYPDAVLLPTALATC